MIHNVLLIDDDVNTNLFNQLILQKTGMVENIITHQSALDALEYLKSNPENIDLILLDINMPKMNGWQFLKEYECLHLENKKNTAIIMLTSSINEKDKQKAMFHQELKAFLKKPILTSKLNEILYLFDAFEKPLKV